MEKERRRRLRGRRWIKGEKCTGIFLLLILDHLISKIFLISSVCIYILDCVLFFYYFQIQLSLLCCVESFRLHVLRKPISIYSLFRIFMTKRILLPLFRSFLGTFSSWLSIPGQSWSSWRILFYFYVFNFQLSQHDIYASLNVWRAKKTPHTQHDKWRR